MGKGQSLYRQARRIIPGGTQLLSKRPEMLLPGLWPSYYKKARGFKVWDIDGKMYKDMSHMSVGTCILGYADKDVDRSVRDAVRNGTISTLNCPEEIELAKLLCDIHPWADKVRFSRTGGEAATIAVRIARAKTGKDLLLFCGYHGWHDWYLSANISDGRALKGHLLPGLEPKGVPRALKNTAIPFMYNDKEGFLKLVKKYKGRIGAVIMEPIRNHYPHKGFLETIREVTGKEKIVLIFDDITAGWRLCVGGSHLKFKVYPDICIFAKGMSNGYPMAAVIGRGDVMQAAQETFISSTYWTERIGPVAALRTIRKIKEKKVPGHISLIGKMAQGVWAKAAKKHRLDIDAAGIYPLSHFSFNHRDSLVLKTLFAQLMLKEGFLATTAFYPTYAHKKEDLAPYFRAVDKTFFIISNALKTGNHKRLLKGAVCHSGFKRLN